MGIFSFFRSKSINIKKPFPKEDCSSLVIYAAKTMDDNPDETFPSFISHLFNSKESSFIPDLAPYLTVLESQDMLDEISKWRDNAFNKADYKIASEAERWVRKMTRQRWKCFMYELEPEKFAGSAYNWAFADEKR